MATTFRLTLGDGEDAISSVFESDGDRVMAYGMRLFDTSDKQAVVKQFSAIFMNKLTSDAVEDEKQIAAKAASDAVAPIIVTPMEQPI